MLNQDLENKIETTLTSTQSEEFQNIEIVIQGIFQILDEYDRVNKIPNLGGEKPE